MDHLMVYSSQAKTETRFKYGEGHEGPLKGARTVS